MKYFILFIFFSLSNILFSKDFSCPPSDYHKMIEFSHNSYQLEKEEMKFIDTVCSSILKNIPHFGLTDFFIIKPISTKEELEINPMLGAFRAEIVINYMVKKFNLQRGDFLIDDIKGLNIDDQRTGIYLVLWSM